MIYCCGGYHTPLKTVFLLPDFQYRERKLELIVCPKCGALRAEITQFNVKDNKYEVKRLKKKKIPRFISDIETGKLKELKIKYGTKERSAFVYGVNKECKDGTIKQYAVDFNGKKKLVKVING